MTPEQAAQLAAAGVRGHRTRRERHELRLAMKAGETTLARALVHPAVAGLTIERLLLWAPGLGAKRTPYVLAQARVSPTRLVGELTQRQRDVLARARW